MSTANEKQIAEKIRSQYTERKVSKLDELKELDQRVKRPAKVFTYLFGCVSALVLGTGMCLAMKVIGDLMVPGIVVGCVGIVMAAVNYPIYQAILKARKKKYADQIFALSNELLHEESKK